MAVGTETVTVENLDLGTMYTAIVCVDSLPESDYPAFDMLIAPCGHCDTCFHPLSTETQPGTGLIITDKVLSYVLNIGYSLRVRLIVIYSPSAAGTR